MRLTKPRFIFESHKEWKYASTPSIFSRSGKEKLLFNSRINAELNGKVVRVALTDKMSNNIHVRDKERKTISGSNP